MPAFLARRLAAALVRAATPTFALLGGAMVGGRGGAGAMSVRVRGLGTMTLWTVRPVVHTKEGCYM